MDVGKDHQGLHGDRSTERCQSCGGALHPRDVANHRTQCARCRRTVGLSSGWHRCPVHHTSYKTFCAGCVLDERRREAALKGGQD